jgi:hypothetical protein
MSSSSIEPLQEKVDDVNGVDIESGSVEDDLEDEVESSDGDSEDYEDDELIEEPADWVHDAVLFPLVAPSFLRMYFVFVDLQRQIKKISYEDVDISTVGITNEGAKERTLSFSFLHHFIINQKYDELQYKLLDTLVFNFDIEHDEVLPFLNSNHLEDVVQNHLRVLPFLNDVTLNPSPLEIHSANSIFFILMQKESVKKPRLQMSPENATGVDDVMDVHYNRTKRQYVSLNPTPTPIRIRRTRKLMKDVEAV